jgi:transcriptional regulator with XRE-family HTH domain
MKAPPAPQTRRAGDSAFHNVPSPSKRERVAGVVPLHICGARLVFAGCFSRGTTGVANPRSAKVIDHLVGAMIAACREDSGLTHKQLALKSRITLDDLREYEAGAKRIAASHLLQVAQALETPISYFFSAIDIAGCTGMDGSESQKLGPAECARVIQIFSQFRSPAAFDAAIAMARSIVVLEDRLEDR